MERAPAPVVVAVLATVLVTSGLAVLAALDLAWQWSALSWPDRGANAFYLLVGLAMALGARQFLRGRVWLRGLLVTWHLLLVISSLALLTVYGPWAVGVAAISLVALVLLASPSARAYVASHRSSGFLTD